MDDAIHLSGDAQLDRGGREAIHAAFAHHPEAIALYWDIVVGDQRQARPAWSPTRVQSEPGVTLPLAVRKSWAEFDPSMTPLELEHRLAETGAQVLHLPAVLTHHSQAPSSTVEISSNDPRFEAGPRPGTRRRKPSTKGQASTSIIIPSAGQTQSGSEVSMLDRCLETLALLDPKPKEVIVVVGDEYRGDPPQQPANLPLRILPRGPGTFDFSRAVNCGLLACRGELVLMLNDDIEAETPDWLGRMAAHLDDPTVGVVGAALLYPDRTVQHVGVVFDDARSYHPFRNYKLADTASFGGDVARDTVSVTGACLLARRRDLLAAGGLSLEYPFSYGDIDLCLKMQRLGLRVVVEPAAVLIHHESASRDPSIRPWEWDRFIHRWGDVVDPWYHPAYWRPNDPESISRNADHLHPVDPGGSWPARSATVQSRMHQSQIGFPPRIHP
ncbi:glycosyltransferase family 2 protein [Candidatus Poriferisocius sp.]|uniref:glycosyltransferase family 2 protein n=1 Tax=Candidatus Poriferisocius sp. TaxID=3101276 RepID=UPI003B024F96